MAGTTTAPTPEAAALETPRQVLAAYRQAIRLCQNALRQQAHLDKAAKSVAAARDIVEVLRDSLDLEAGGSIARQLRRVYQFMFRRLTQARARYNARAIREVIDLLSELETGFSAVCS